jgi:uncharacterized protein (DUF1697 family)
MKTYVALLRAVNVGGTGKLPMAELKKICEGLGFRSVRTYIASGNVVFQSPKPEAQVKALLEGALEAYAGKAVGVLVRTGEEMAAVLAANPFAAIEGNRVAAYFLDREPGADALKTVTNQESEEIRLGRREIYVHYPHGMGQSKLRIPAVKNGTARNMNTVAKLAEMMGEG